MDVISPVNIKDRAGLGIRTGDTVRVWVIIKEKDKTRLQAFEGVVLAVKHGSEAGGTFTVRRTTGGFGVEKIFPLYSPMIDKIEIIKRAKVRRAKLYHIREKAAKDIRREMRNMKLVSISTSDNESPEETSQIDADNSQPNETNNDTLALAEKAEENKEVIEKPK